ncbi:quino protein amine dehydrogenase beta chain-like protein [Xylogone sp. PMI_703]|nr:quino protein amine dehydrogenase beta chain-like protein [Xylogone sp. PMI_703]
MDFNTLFSLIALIISQIVVNARAHQAEPAALPLPYLILHQWTDPTFIENLAVRSNGEILLNFLTTPELWLLSPTRPEEPVLLYTFPKVLGLVGITELQPDIFYVVAGNFSVATGDFGVGSYSVWKVDLTSYSKHHSIVVDKVTDMPEAHLLNGNEVLTETKDGGIIIIADSARGVVWQLDVQTKKYSILVDLPEMKPTTLSPFQLGINGIKVRDSYLYWTAGVDESFNRVKINTSGQAVGKVEAIRTGRFGDDFVLDKHGNAWIATQINNTIEVISQDFKKQRVVLGDLKSLTVPGATACRFGRTKDSLHTLYVSTGGGLLAPINGTVTEGGKLLAVDTRGFRI